MKTTVNFGEKKVINVSAKFLQVDTPEWSQGYKKYHYIIIVKVGNNTKTFDFWNNKQMQKVSELREALYAWADEACAGDMDMDEFASEFGYDKVSECLKAWRGCKHQRQQAKELGINPYDLANFLREKYDL